MLLACQIGLAFAVDLRSQRLLLLLPVTQQHALFGEIKSRRGLTEISPSYVRLRDQALRAHT